MCIFFAKDLEISKISCNFAAANGSYTIMATVTLNYDARNDIAQKALDFLLSLGVFQKKERVSAAEKRTQKAIEELESGKGTVCHSFEDYLNAVK